MTEPSSIMREMEDANKKSEDAKPWSGTFREFLQLFQTGEYPNMGVLSHSRIYNMIISSGTKKENYFGKKRLGYKFFEDHLFGIEESIDSIVSYIHSAAQRTETSRRMLLIFGPPSSGKSEIVNLIKKGLEAYSRTKEGAIFAIKDSKMNENPFLLVPHHLRSKFHKEYGLPVEGNLSPQTQYELDHTYQSKFMDVPINRIFLSEASRTGIGTYLPQDPKCITSDCTILTENGLIKGEDLFIPILEGQRHVKYAVGMNAKVKIKNCYDNGIRPVYRVNLRGTFIETTANHRLLTINTNGEFVFEQVSSIVGKSIPLAIGTNTFGKKIKLKKLNESVYNNRHHEVHLPELLTPELSRLVGYLVAEGSCSDATVGLSNQDHIVNSDAVNIIKNEFLLEPKIQFKEVARGDTLVKLQRGISIAKSRFVDFMNINFELTPNACEKEVPGAILSAPKECQIEFLEGLFIGDGAARVRNSTASIKYASCSEKMISQLQSMLINLGCFGTISKRRDKQYPKNLQYAIVMEGADAVHLSRLLSKFSKNRNVDFVNHPVREYQTYESFGDLHGLIKDIKSSVYDSYKFVDSRYTSTSKHRRTPTRASLLKWMECLNSTKCHWSDISNKESILSRIHNLLKYRCIPVLSTKYVGMKHVFDLEVDHKDHTFIVNGIPSHNSSDQSELVGGIDFARIQEVGSESDPRAYNFDGELNVSNRGVFEMIEALKVDERFIRVLLTATQEKSIKAPRFGLIYVDCMIILHTNEAEFESFMSERKYEAYHDRMVIAKAPYNCSVSNEVRIYEKLLSNSDAVNNIHISPKSLEVASMFAVLTRLEDSKGDLTILKKMKLYDSKHVRGFKIEQVPDIKKKYPREGMTGISPRFVIDQIAAAISNARKEERDYITALDVLRQINSAIINRDSFTKDQKTQFLTYIDMARSEWNDMLRNDIQKAFFVSFEHEARELCEKYLDHVDAACSGTKPRDPVTDEEVEVDEKLMDEIESHIDISNSGKEDFRQEIIRAFGSAARKQKAFDYTQHAHLREAIQKQLFQERQNVIRMTVSSRNPDEDAMKRINQVVERMVDDQGYSAASANELLKYASAHLFDK